VHHAEQIQTAGRPPFAVRRSVWIAVAALGCLFFLTQHDLLTVTYDNYTQTTADFEEDTAGGNTIRRAAFLGLALAGAGLLVVTGGKKFSSRGVAPWLALGFVAWCCVSVLWSDEPGMTLRRVVVLLCVFLGAAGLARWFSPRELCLIVFSVILAHTVFGVMLELAAGAFTPWQAGYRFAGTMHPNMQGVQLVAMCVAAFCLSRSWPRFKVLLYAVCIAGAVLIVLTKSRTSAAGLLLAMGALWLVQTSSTFKFATGVTAGLLVMLVFLFFALNGFDYDQAARYVFLGRTEDTSSLTGRLPLWTDLAGYVESRPLMGYGYNSFWTAEHIELVSDEVEWAIRESHNAYIETTLGVGIVGVLLLTFAVLAAMHRAAKAVSTGGQPAAAFFFALAVFGLAHGLAESMMTMEMFAPFMLACGLLQLTLFEPAAGGQPEVTSRAHRQSEPVSLYAAMYTTQTLEKPA